MGALADVDEALHPHPDQPDPGPLEAQGVEQGTGRGVDVAADVGGVAQGPGPGDRREVGEPHLDRDGAAHHAGGADPGGGAVAELEQVAVDDGRVVDVVGEGLVGADAASRAGSGTTARGSRPQASACRWAPATSPSARRRVSTGVCAMSATVRRPSRREGLLGLLPHTPQRADGQLVQEADDLGLRARRSGRRAWPGRRRAWRRTWSDATPTEQVMPCSSATVSRTCWAMAAGLPSRRRDARDVEERLVERQRLDHRGDAWRRSP